jgi:tRNA pseudouridine32 synthase/23S rRNA pseudouridine746 synthase
MVMESYNPPQDPWLVILYQDEHIMVVNKPSGLLSVPGLGRAQRQRDDAYSARLSAGESVHRLDMATSGVIVVALTKRRSASSSASSASANRKSSMWRASGDTRAAEGWWIYR